MLVGRWQLAASAWCGVLAVLACALAVLAPSAYAEGFDFKKVFGPDGTEGSGFTGAGSVAVDQSEDVVYVLDGGHFNDGEAGALFKFDLEGNPVNFGGSSPNIAGNEVSNISIEGFPQRNQQVAVDSTTHTIYLTGTEGPPFGESTAILAFESNGEPHEFTAGPGAGTNELSIPETPGAGGVSVAGVAVDSQGNIYASDSKLDASALFIYTRTGATLLSLPAGTIAPTNLAVDSKGVVYVTGSGAVSRLLPSEYPISGTTTYTNDGQLDAIGARSVAVDPKTNEVYVSQESQVSVFDEGKTLLATMGGPGEPGEVGGIDSAPFGLAVDSEAERIFVAHQSGGDSGVYRIFVFEKSIFEGPPTIESESVTGVTADSAKLQARINPNTHNTTYWFEYGLADCSLGSCMRVPVSGASIGSGHQPVAVARTVTGLQAETSFHYRVVAENDLGITDGVNRTFTTQSSALGFELSDSRVWEMVSPPDKHSGLLVLPASGIIQAAAGGDGLAYLSLGSIEARPDGNRALEASSVLSRRSTGAWSTKDITPPHVEATGARAAEYRLMTSDLSLALMEARDGAPLSPLTTERTPYLRENAQPPLYTPLLTSAEGHANVPPGTEFDRPGLAVMGANQALTVVALKSQAPLVAGADEEALYGWRAGQIEAISELPLGEGGGVVSASLGSGLGSVRNAVSEDGSRVFWSPGQGYSVEENKLPALYLRDTLVETSVRLDVVQGGSGTGEPHPAFQAASADGTIVFFTDSQQLTESASPEGRDLYRCEIPTGASLTGCNSLTTISAPLSGESAMVKDQALALSEDGRRIYFVAEGVLDEAPNGEDAVAHAGEPNLYLWEEGKGTRFIATLSKGDASNWGVSNVNSLGNAGHISADASPSGRYLAFMSEQSLTGYENREASSNEPAQEVFRYDATSDQLACVSCNPAGSNPEARFMPDAAGGSIKVDPLGLWAKHWVAATLSEPRSKDFGDTLYRPRSVLDNGRVFFNAVDSLVPGDSNGEWDVYQYESTGVGSCTASSVGAGISRSGDGCVGLISSGTGKEEAVFLDASLTGNDAFFLSSAKLSALEEDDLYDVYDARVDGVAAQPLSHSECLGETCQPAVRPPDDPPPASSSFQGRGNLGAGAQCNMMARRVDQLRRRVRLLHRQAENAESKRDATRLRRKAKRTSQKANSLGKKAKQCRSAGRKAVR